MFDLYRYIFRVRLPFLLAVAATILICVFCNGCARGNRIEDAKQKEVGRKIVEAQLSDADAAIRKYTTGSLQKQTRPIKTTTN